MAGKPVNNTEQIKPAVQQESTACNKAVRPDRKEKSTFNLTLDTLNNLEDAWVLLRRKLKGTQRITKTLIVEKAIEIALDDLESKSELSELCHRICE